jgi:hypothetical protein
MIPEMPRRAFAQRLRYMKLLRGTGGAGCVSSWGHVNPQTLDAVRGDLSINVTQA